MRLSFGGIANNISNKMEQDKVQKFEMNLHYNKYKTPTDNIW